MKPWPCVDWWPVRGELTSSTIAQASQEMDEWCEWGWGGINKNIWQRLKKKATLKHCWSVHRRSVTRRRLWRFLFVWAVGDEVWMNLYLSSPPQSDRWGCVWVRSRHHHTALLSHWGRLSTPATLPIGVLSMWLLSQKGNSFVLQMYFYSRLCYFEFDVTWISLLMTLLCSSVLIVFKGWRCFNVQDGQYFQCGQNGWKNTFL